MIWLIEIREQAAIAAGDTGVLPFLDAPSRSWEIKVHQIERLARDLRHTVCIGDQTVEHPCATFGRLVKQDRLAFIALGQRLAQQLPFLQLRDDLVTIKSGDARVVVERVRIARLQSQPTTTSK